MKKICSVLLAIVLCLSFVGCGNSEKAPSTEERIEAAVKVDIIGYLLINYQNAKISDVTYNIRNLTEDSANVSGLVTVTDQYGYTYTGKYDATVECEDDGTWDADCVVDKLYKN